MALVPKDLMEQIADLEKLFIVPTEKLMTITDHFVSELEKGIHYLESVNGRVVKGRRQYCLSTIVRCLTVAYASRLGGGIS
jgi:hexokinase